MNEIKTKITNIKKNSPAYYSPIEVGDMLMAVDGIDSYTDLIQLRMAFAEQELELDILAACGKRKKVIIEKEIDEDLGLEFESAVFDGVRECYNNCQFCFVAQMPKGLRDTLYVKDDDYRLSFLYGNFITLTNMTEADRERIVREQLSPLYISVQATDVQARTTLMRNKNAGEIVNQLKYFKSHGIAFHTQIVLCPERNDGEILLKTVRDLIDLAPATLSVAIVPVGLTRFRDGLTELRSFTAAECRTVIEQIGVLQDECRQKFGRTFVYLADEFYINADMSVPSKEYYDDFSQLENGIGLTRVFIDEWQNTNVSSTTNDKFLIVTGVSASYVLGSLVDKFNALSQTEHLVYGQKNNFFGETVTVTGLLTAEDFARAIAANPGYDKIVIPEVCLRKGEAVFLDNVYWEEFKKSFPAKQFYIVGNGCELKKLLAGGVEA